MKYTTMFNRMIVVSLFSFALPLPALAGRESIPANVFACAQSLMQTPANYIDPKNPFPITALPLENEVEAIVFPGSRAVEKGRVSEGIFVVTKKSINCHQLPTAKTDHTMGTEWKNYDIALDYPKSEVPSGPLRFQFSVGKDAETGKFIDTKVTVLLKGGKQIKPHACLDPASPEYAKIIETLRSIAKTFSGQVTKQASKDIKTSAEVASFVDQNINAIKSCHALNDPQLDAVIDNQVAIMEKSINKLAVERKTARAQSPGSPIKASK
jgi:hypothetical protein